MHVIISFVKTVSDLLRGLLGLRVPPPLRPLVRIYETFVNGEAPILQIYLQDKFPVGNLVNLV
jgi:hypothetical protein